MDHIPATPESRSMGYEPNEQHHHEHNDDRMEIQSEASDDTQEEDETLPVGEDVNNLRSSQLEQQQPSAVEISTNYSLFNNPPNLGTMRRRLFEVEDVIEMSTRDFGDYFPFIDNVWRRLRTAEPQGDRTVTTEWYWCRMRKGGSHKPQSAKPTPEGKQMRKKRTREDKVCGMALKVVYNESYPNSCTIVKGVGKEERHTHDLDYVDATKRCTGIMDVARREAVKGFLPTSVFWKMWEEPENMREAGGKSMKVSDVRNVQYPWRQMNHAVVLKAHSGYTHARTGPRAHQPRPNTAVPQAAQRSTAPVTPTIAAAPIASTTPIGPTAPITLTAPIAPTAPIVPTVPVAPMAPIASAPILPIAPSPVASIMPTTQLLDPAKIPQDALQYPDNVRGFLEPYLLSRVTNPAQKRPHVTLTWATSLDSKISLLPGVQTAISSIETKAMTHYLRSRHDAIVIGVRTAMSDDPALNCRLIKTDERGGVSWDFQPRPIIIDPHARLLIKSEMRMLKAVQEGRGKAPWIVVSPNAMLHPVAVSTLKHHGGEFLMINDFHPEAGGLNWEGVFNVLYREGLRSIMVEGGGIVLSELIKPKYTHLVDSVIMTIAPTFFGKAGTTVSPDTTMDNQQRPIATRLRNVRWQPMGQDDVVMCGHLKYDPPLLAINGPAPPVTQAPPSQPPSVPPLTQAPPPQQPLSAPRQPAATPESNPAQPQINR